MSTKIKRTLFGILLSLLLVLILIILFKLGINVGVFLRQIFNK